MRRGSDSLHFCQQPAEIEQLAFQIVYGTKAPSLRLSLNLVHPRQKSRDSFCGLCKHRQRWICRHFPAQQTFHWYRHRTQSDGMERSQAKVCPLKSLGPGNNQLRQQRVINVSPTSLQT